MTDRPEPAGLPRFNALTEREAVESLTACCGSARWASRIAALRPFPSFDALVKAADEVWSSLAPADWLEAFAHHPRIGERNLAAARFARTAEQSAREQSSMASAAGPVLEELARLNEEYERRFGHVFLIRASGRSSDEMLAALRERLLNDPATELNIAAHQQGLITRLRLERMLLS